MSDSLRTMRGNPRRSGTRWTGIGQTDGTERGVGNRPAQDDPPPHFCQGDRVGKYEYFPQGAGKLDTHFKREGTSVLSLYHMQKVTRNGSQP